MKQFLKKHKRAAIAGAVILAAVLGVGLFVPVRIEVRQTGKLHQHAALTEKDFVVQTSTLFGMKYDAEGYKVSWNGWTEEQQAAILEQLNQPEEDGDQSVGVEAFANENSAGLVTADDILKMQSGEEETGTDALLERVEGVLPKGGDAANAAGGAASQSADEAGDRDGSQIESGQEGENLDGDQVWNGKGAGNLDGSQIDSDADNLDSDQIDAENLGDGQTWNGTGAGNLDGSRTDSDADNLDGDQTDTGIDADNLDGDQTNTGIDADNLDGGQTETGIDADNLDGDQTETGIDAENRDGSKIDSGKDAGNRDSSRVEAGIDTEKSKKEETVIVTGDTVTEYTVSKGGLTDRIKVDPIPVAEIRAVYSEPLYYLEAPNPEKITASLVYEDGAEVEVPCTSEVAGECTGEMDVAVHTEYGDAVCHIVPVMPARLGAEYKGKVYAGEEALPKDVLITVTFTDGHTTKANASEFLVDAVVNDPGDFHVGSAYGETDVHIDPVPITGASIEVNKILYEEDMLEFDEITLEYEDGKKKAISKDEVELGAEAMLPLTAGKNEIPFIYNGKMYTFAVDVLHDNEIRRARMRYAEEIKTAEYSHLTDTIMVTVNRYTEGEYSYLLTHIIIDDPSQIHAGLSYDDYGGERETPSSAAERLGWVVGINGSNFDYTTDTPTMADAIIKNGQVMPDSKATANGMEICLTSSGNLFSPQQGMTVGDLLNMGVTDTWCCGDTLLISNGEPVNVGIQSLDYRYPRTAIGMVRPCEYYLITAGSEGYANGMTYDEIRDTLVAHDCGFGKCLDGGGSSTLIFENQMLNSPATGSERPVTDFLYFTE